MGHCLNPCTVKCHFSIELKVDGGGGGGGAGKEGRGGCILTAWNKQSFKCIDQKEDFFFFLSVS